MGDLNLDLDLDVVFSVEEQKEKEREKAEEESVTESKRGEMNGLMRWEKFLPRMILRVLLVEADDSTRQIISALLRKCSYRGLNNSLSASQFFASFNFIVTFPVNDFVFFLVSRC